MNLDELQSAQSRERQTDSLQQLRDSFYEEAGEFIEELRDQRDYAAERADSPFDDPEVSRLTDDIQTAEQTVEAIYERRVGKIVKMASLAAADMPAEEEGLTREERDLFETLVGAIEQNREHVLAVLAGEADGPDAPVDTEGVDSAVTGSEPADTEPAPADGQQAATRAADAPADDSDSGASVERSESGAPHQDPSAADAPQPEPDRTGATDGSPDRSEDAPAVDAADLMGGDDAGTDEDGTVTDDDGEEDVDRRMVRITDDVGTILGVDDREYDLSSDDVVRLPAANAGPLVERDAAEPLE